MTQLIGGLLYISLLFIPGWLLTRLILPKQHQFLFSYALSIVILTATSTVASVIGYSYFGWLTSVLISAIVLGATNLYLRNQRRSSLRPEVPTPIVLELKRSAPGALLILTLFSCYYLWVGAYSEIPSDIWIHLARVNHLFLESGPHVEEGCWPLDCLTDQGHLIYLLHASISSLLGVSPVDLIGVSPWVGGTIFLLSLYFFAIYVFAEGGVPTNLCALGAFLAASLTLITFGTASFSFVQYYSYFPVIFAFPMLFLTVLLFIDFLESKPWSVIFCWISIPLLILQMFLIHRQEAFFSLLLIGMLALICGAQTFASAEGPSSASFYRKRWSFSLTILLGTSLALGLLLTRELTPWHNTPHVVDAGSYWPLLEGLPLDNPQFRLWDTIGLSGLVVFFWAVYRWRITLRSKFLLASLLIPVVTNLNPLFANLFLRVEMPSTLWRTAYLFPVGLIASFLVVNTLFRSGGRRNLASDYLLFVCLIVACVPWQLNDYFNRTSRIPSFFPTSKASGVELWRDLIDATFEIQSRMPIKRIITDSVTGFVLYSATRGEVRRWSEGEYFPRNNLVYKTDFLESDYSGSLLIINRRNGALTDNAQFAGHWPADTLTVSAKYPPDLDEFIDSNPNLFERLWSSGDIEIFLMKFNVN